MKFKISYDPDEEEVERIPPDPRAFILCKQDLGWAVAVGSQRKAFQYNAHFFGEIEQNRSGRPRMDLGADPWNSPLSACCELGVARELGLNWEGDSLSHKHTVDVPPDIEVRYSVYRDLLRLYTNDDPRSKYVLVRGKIPQFRILGWIQGKDGMLPKYIDREPNAVAHSYLVPLSHLRPFEELKRLVEEDKRYDPYRIR